VGFSHSSSCRNRWGGRIPSFSFRSRIPQLWFYPQVAFSRLVNLHWSTHWDTWRPWWYYNLLLVPFCPSSTFPCLQLHGPSAPLVSQHIVSYAQFSGSPTTLCINVCLSLPREQWHRNRNSNPNLTEMAKGTNTRNLNRDMLQWLSTPQPAFNICRHLVDSPVWVWRRRRGGVRLVWPNCLLVRVERRGWLRRLQTAFLRMRQIVYLGWGGICRTNGTYLGLSICYLTANFTQL